MRAPRSLSALWLIPIVAIAAGIRFYALTQRGLIYWDEGKYALEGERFLVIGQALIHGHGSILAGKAVGTAKPLHALLIAGAFAIFGVHDYAPLAMNAALSLLQILLVYLLARRLFDGRSAVLAALLLAVSEYDAIYARSALSESDGNVILVAAALVWAAGWRLDGATGEWRGSGRRLLLAGILLGAAFTVNYRLIVYAGVFVAFDLAWSAYRSGFRSAATRIPAWAAGIIAPVLLWQVVDLVARARDVILFRNELTGAPRSYLASVVYQLHEGKQSAINFQPDLYLHWLVIRQGLPFVLLTALGLILAARYRSLPWLFPASLVVVPYAVYAFAPFIVARNLAAAIPFGCVVAAAALVRLVDAVLPQVPSRVVLLLAAVVLGILGASLSWRLTGEVSGYAKSAAYVQQRHGRALAPSETTVFYLRGNGAHCAAVRLPSSFAKLAADVRAGYTYAVLDHYVTPVQQFIAHRTSWLAGYASVGTTSLGEDTVETEDYPRLPGIIKTRVDVYHLWASRLPPPTVPPDICNREIVLPR